MCISQALQTFITLPRWGAVNFHGLRQVSHPWIWLYVMVTSAWLLSVFFFLMLTVYMFSGKFAQKSTKIDFVLQKLLNCNTQT